MGVLRTYYILQTASTPQPTMWMLRAVAVPAKETLAQTFRFCCVNKRGELSSNSATCNGMLVHGYQRIRTPHTIRAVVFVCNTKDVRKLRRKVAADTSLRGLNLFVIELNNMPVRRAMLQFRKGIDARIFNVAFPLFDTLIRFSLVSIVSAYILTAIYICLTIQQRKGAILLPILLDNRQTRKAVDTETSSLCAICLDDYNDDVQIRELSCKHTFHQKCVDQWLLSTCSLCPLCRQSLVL